MTPIRSAEVNELLAMVLSSGIVQQYAGSVAPAGWLLCNGASYLRTDYPDLFSAIGVKYGSADGTHFNVPDCRGRVPVGKDGTAEFFDLGTTGGEKSHTLSISELPSHYHTVDPPITNTGGISANHRHWVANYNGGGNSTGYSITNATPHGDSRYWNFNNSSWSSYVESGHVHAVDIGQFNSGNSGGGATHNNLQPYITFNFIVKI